MSVLTRVGHAAVTIKGERFLFVPSLANISSMADPVATYADLYGHSGADAMREAAIKVLTACCDNPSIVQHIGRQQVGKTRARPDGRGGFVTTRTYTDVFIDDVHLACIAQQLMLHGLIGVSPKRPTKEGSKPQYDATFKAEEYAAAAMAHLGMSSAEAWTLTMTELAMAMHAKYPPTKEELSQMKALDDYDRAMAWKNKLFEGAK